VSAHPEPQARRAIRRALWMLGLTLGVGVLAGLAIARQEHGREAIRALLERSDPAGVLLGVLIITAATPIAALRWRCLLPPEAKVRGATWNLTWIQCVAVLFNYALPGPVGELVAADLAKRCLPISTSEALMARVVVRLLGLGVAAVLAAGVFLLAPLPMPDNARDVGLAAVLGLLLGAGAIGLAATRPRTLQGLVARALGPLVARPGWLGRSAGRAHQAADGLLEALAAIGHRGPRPLLHATLWTFVGHTVSPTGVAVAAWSMGIELPWLGVVFTNAFVIVGALALFLFPGSQLGWDAMYCTILAGSTGASLADAATVTVLTRAQESLLVLLGVGATVAMLRWWVGSRQRT
jgi:hypothetical protein